VAVLTSWTALDESEPVDGARDLLGTGAIADRRTPSTTFTFLLNYQWDSRTLLSVILVDLPELRDRLALRGNRSLYSRIHHRLEIEPLLPEGHSFICWHRSP